ncbi:hypothetical protein FN846DRAFT_387020 [Sphaerosporella brunnea]|uniref:ERCC4 domain-containing protein n=1 Tax=Sphaerosporella brunnea TaxID=1250544 RepID=A0A5J5EGC5_9PEZI|nr:hypothetical protein FN846DRAFT_387020 [Sphaerosporella brunnea]
MLPLFSASGFDEDLLSSPQVLPTMPSSPPLLSRSKSHPPAPKRTVEELDPIEFTSSAPQLPPRRARPEVIEIDSDSDGDLVPIQVPVSTKRKLEEKETQNKRARAKSIDINGLDLGNSSKGSEKPPAKTTAEPVYFESDYDDSLLNDWEGPTPGKPVAEKKKQPETFLLLSSSFDDFDFGIEKPKPAPAPASAGPSRSMSAATLRILKELREKNEQLEVEAISDSDDEGEPSKKPTKGKAPAVAGRATSTGVSNRNRLTEEEKARRAAEKAAKSAEKDAKNAEKAARNAEKAAEKARKQAEKGAAIAAKKQEAELNSLNKLKISKKESAPEMIVDVSTAFFPSEFGDQITRFVQNLGSEVLQNWRPPGVEPSWKVIKWRRKKKSTYDEEKAMFVPLVQPEICDEKHILVHLTATEFVALAYPDVPGVLDLDKHVAKMKLLVPSCPDVRVIYLIEGLAAYARKSKNAINAGHRSQVLERMGGPAAAAARRPQPRIITEDMLEDAQLKLQVTHNCLIHTTAGSIESAEWISIFTGDISSIPYKTSRMVLDTSFCAAIGQVKTGVDAEDTWCKMLQEIQRVTPAHANGIVGRYPSVKDLVGAFRRNGDEVLHDICLLTTRDGAPSNRTIGVAASKRICGVFTQKDATTFEDVL